MTFIEAMQSLMNGQCIRRGAWGDKTYHFSKENTGIYQFTPGDLDATDWEVYNKQ